jgi:uncharacterized membrane protein HdeD (DUF308 family)
MTDIGGTIPPPPRPVGYENADRRLWWAPMVAGVLLVLLGVWMLTNPFESVTVLAILVGVSLIVGGFMEAAVADDLGLGWLAWVGGALFIVAGVVVLAWPDITLWALAVATGITLVVTGALHCLWALGRPDKVPHLLIGGVGIVVGLAVVAWPDATLIVLALLTGLRALVTGLVAIGVGWQLHRLAA